MLHGRRIAVVVPAHNEERLILATLRGMPDFVDLVVVVDDGSSDRTGMLASTTDDARVYVVRHRSARGVGAAIAAGYEVAFEHGADVAAVMAGDDQMDPRDLEHVVSPVALGEADYVKGDRLSHASCRSEMPLTRFIGNHALSALTRAATGARLSDSQCGYTAISREAEARLRARNLYTGYGYPNVFIAEALAEGLRVQDVIVRPKYGEEESGIRLKHALVTIPILLAGIRIRRASGSSSTIA